MGFFSKKLKKPLIHKAFFWVKIGQEFHSNGLVFIRVGNLEAKELKSEAIFIFSSEDDVLIEDQS